jgi:aminodeoxyfutalosine deaminase
LTDERQAFQFARGIPKAEIHLHLEGSVDLETLLRVLRGRGEPTDAVARRRLAAFYVHRDFPHFLQNFGALCSEIRRPEDFALITTALSDRLGEERVRYAEVFCSPGIFARRGLRADEIMDAVSGAARERESRGGPRMRFLFDGVRQFGVPAFEDLVRSADACRRYDVIGVGVGGDEKALPAAALAPAYREARRLGLHTTVHAGEFDGPRSVWEALEILEVERVGHGVRAVEDLELVRVLSRRGTPLECCPTSNVRTGVARSWQDHPIRTLHGAGVAITVNSDDPGLFGTTLTREWEALGTRLGLAPGEILAIGLRTARSTFLPQAERQALADAMTSAATECGVGV